MARHQYHYELALAAQFSANVCKILEGTICSRSREQAEIDAVMLETRGMDKEARKRIRVASVTTYRLEGEQ